MLLFKMQFSTTCLWAFMIFFFSGYPQVKLQQVLGNEALAPCKYWADVNTLLGDWWVLLTLLHRWKLRNKVSARIRRKSMSAPGLEFTLAWFLNPRPAPHGYQLCLLPKWGGRVFPNIERILLSSGHSITGSPFFLINDRAGKLLIRNLFQSPNFESKKKVLKTQETE